MPETLSLENRVALVTGGSRGIGRAVALELAARGAAVVVNYNKSSEAADEVVKKIQEAGGKAAGFQADVSDRRGVVGHGPGKGDGAIQPEDAEQDVRQCR